MEETRKQQIRTDEPMPASTTDQKRQDAVRENWAKLKAEAEERRQNSSDKHESTVVPIVEESW
jgi:hypothetical protein